MNKEAKHLVFVIMLMMMMMMTLINARILLAINVAQACLQSTFCSASIVKLVLLIPRRDSKGSRSQPRLVFWRGDDISASAMFS